MKKNGLSHLISKERRCRCSGSASNGTKIVRPTSPPKFSMKHNNMNYVKKMSKQNVSGVSLSENLGG